MKVICKKCGRLEDECYAIKMTEAEFIVWDASN